MFILRTDVLIVLYHKQHAVGLGKPGKIPLGSCFLDECVGKGLVIAFLYLPGLNQKPRDWFFQIRGFLFPFSGRCRVTGMVKSPWTAEQVHSFRKELVYPASRNLSMQ